LQTESVQWADDGDDIERRLDKKMKKGEGLGCLKYDDARISESDADIKHV